MKWLFICTNAAHRLSRNFFPGRRTGSAVSYPVGPRITIRNSREPHLNLSDKEANTESLMRSRENTADQPQDVPCAGRDGRRAPGRVAVGGSQGNTPGGAIRQAQPQEGFEPEIHPLRIAAAHPTPGWTAIASAGQFIAQAPHSMQASRSRIRAFPCAAAKTP